MIMRALLILVCLLLCGLMVFSVGFVLSSLLPVTVVVGIGFLITGFLVGYPLGISSEQRSSRQADEAILDEEYLEEESHAG